MTDCSFEELIPYFRPETPETHFGVWRSCLPRYDSTDCKRSQSFTVFKVKRNKGYWELIYCWFSDRRMLAHKCWHARCIWYGENRLHLVKSSANRRVEAGWTSSVSQTYKSRMFHSVWRDPVRVHRKQDTCGAIWDVEHILAMVSLNIYKTTQMN